MKLNQIFEDARISGQQLAQQVEQALKQAGWSESFDMTPKGTTYTKTRAGENGVAFHVAVVNSMDRQEVTGQLSAKVLNQLITPYFYQARNVGIVFSQPVGLPNSSWEGNGYQGSVIQFQIGQ